MSSQTQEALVKVFSLDGITYASMRFRGGFLTLAERALCEAVAKRAKRTQFGEVKLVVTEDGGRHTGDMLAVLPLKRGVKVKVLEKLIADMLPTRTLVVERFTNPANPRLGEAMQLRQILLS